MRLGAETADKKPCREKGDRLQTVLQSYEFSLENTKYIYVFEHIIVTLQSKKGAGHACCNQITAVEHGLLPVLRIITYYYFYITLRRTVPKVRYREIFLCQERKKSFLSSRSEERRVGKEG